VDRESTPYERRVRAEIEAWGNEQEGALTKALNVAGLPVGWAYERIPDAGRRTVERTVLGFMEMLRDGSRWTYPDGGVVEEARKLGIEVDDYRDLRHHDLEKLDRIARGYFGTNKAVALEGAGCGLGGMALIVADILLLFGIAFRAVQQIGSCYGFDMEDPEMTPVVMGVFNVGSTASSTDKTAALMDMRVAAVAFGKNWTYGRVAESTSTGVVAALLKERTKHLPKDIANNVTKRKLAQAIPLVGAAVGAGFNYWFLSNTTRAAYMVFREMYLARKYGGDGDGEPTGLAPNTA
jgi:hypothetical protein